MRKAPPALHPDQPDPTVLHRLYFVQQVCLAVVAQLAVLTLAVWLFTPLAHLLPTVSTGMSAYFALAALFSTFSFFLSESGRSRTMLQLSRLFAVLTALVATVVFLEPVLHTSSSLNTFLNAGQTALSHGHVPLRPATAFALLAVVMILVRVTNPLIVHIADILTSCLCLLVLILFSEYLFGALRFFGLSTARLTSPQTLACLVPLTLVAALRQAEHGIFSIFLGPGIGSKIARILSPILIALPFLREAGRARLVNSHLIPASYATAILASLATGTAFVLLVFLAWHINGMEKKIHDLTLRDELTGLHNLRGFYLLAEQALRLARRSQTPFSVLFIDLDNLKQINDKLGHSMGSVALAETARLLNATFREVDVIGRIGGDEFVVAGQFSRAASATAIQRLHAASALRSSEAGKPFTLSFSIGCATTDHNAHESLKDLVTEADSAMYQEKRRKKLLQN